LSIENYEKAKQLIYQNEKIADFVGGRNNHLIFMAEKKLGLTFSNLYRDFLLSFGAGNFGSQEIYGIIKEDFENSSVPDAIWYTLTERKESDLPMHLLVIYDTGGDELFCLDFNHVGNNKEPKMVSFIPGISLENQQYKIIANDFGDFLLDLVQQEI